MRLIKHSRALKTKDLFITILKDFASLLRPIGDTEKLLNGTFERVKLFVFLLCSWSLADKSLLKMCAVNSEILVVWAGVD